MVSNQCKAGKFSCGSLVYCIVGDGDVLFLILFLLIFSLFLLFSSGLSIEESKDLTESMDIPEPAKSSVLSGKPEIVKESQKINPVTEVIHMELRSRDVKSTVTHAFPEEPVKPPASEQSRLSLDMRKDTQEELISESSVQKAVDPKPCSEKTLENEIACKPPASPLEAAVTCSKGKETQTTKEESPVGNAEQITESNKAGSPITAVTSEPLKRKFSTELDTELRTEKKPRVSSSETSSTVTDKEKVEQRVPPLKVSFRFISFEKQNKTLNSP